jgi:hypothetical protein
MIAMGLALGADVNVVTKGKSVVVYLDGQEIGETPLSVEIGRGFHEVIAKSDAVSAAALTLKFVVFDQTEGRIQFDWRKQEADLMWPGEERLKSRDRLLLRNRELSIAKQPGMFTLPETEAKQTYKSPEDLTFLREERLVVPDEDVSVEGLAEEIDLGDEEDFVDDEPGVDDEPLDMAALENDGDLPKELDDESGMDFLDDELLTEGSDSEEGAEPDDNFPEFINFEQIVSSGVDSTEQDDLIDSLNLNDIEIPDTSARPISEPRVQPVAIRESRGLRFQPWMVGAGAAVVAGGFFGQASLQWTMAKGYAERARNMEGSVGAIAEYQFNAEYAQKKSGLARATMGVGSVVLASGIGVTIALGKR